MCLATAALLHVTQQDPPQQTPPQHGRLGWQMGLALCECTVGLYGVCYGCMCSH